MITIWGRRNSSNVGPVMWTLGELGLEYSRINVGGSFGGLDTEEYGRLNPNRLIPTMQDNRVVVWESNAIVRYLCAQYGAGLLWPEDPARRALADQWMEWAKTTFVPKFYPVFWQLIRVPEGQQDLALVEQAAVAAGKALQVLEAHLENHDFVAGDTLSMGDIPGGLVMYRFFNLDIQRPALPNVEAWYARLCERPAYQQHAMVPFGSNNQEWIELEKAGA